MGSEVIEPQSIRNVTVVGDPDETMRVVHRLLRTLTGAGTGRTATVRWAADNCAHTIRITELSSHLPTAPLERSIRVADGLIAVMNAAAARAPRLETALRIADDHQVARLCLVTGLDQPAADFDRCLRTIAGTHGAGPVALQVPHGLGPDFDGALDLIPEPRAADRAVTRWPAAEQWYDILLDTVGAPKTPDSDELAHPRTFPADRLHDRLRHLTHIGDIAPVLCDTTPWRRISPILDAIVRYLPSPMHVCQPEHALDY